MTYHDYLTRRWFFKECGVGLGAIALHALLQDRASVLRELGRYNESGDDIRRARDVFEALTREQPANQQLRNRLAAANLDDALLRLDMGRIDEALPSFRRGLDILDGRFART